MPMNNVSTLIYFVNNFQTDSEYFEEESLNTTFMTKMENSEVGPSEQSIENIMDFARSYEVLETKETGYVEMILN